jgi:hypothetical protein
VALSTCFLSLFFFTRTGYRTELVPELAATDLSNSGGLHGSPPPAWASLFAACSAPCLGTNAPRRRSAMGLLQRRAPWMRRLLQEMAGSATIGSGVCYKGQRLLQAGCWCLLRVALVFAKIGGDYCYYKGGHGAKGAERRLLRMPEAERFVTSGGSCCEHQRRLLQTERHHAARRPANLAAVLPQAICEGRWGCRHGLRGGKPGSTSPALAVRECREERRG